VGISMRLFVGTRHVRKMPENMQTSSKNMKCDQIYTA